MSSLSQLVTPWAARSKEAAKDRPVTSVAFDGGLAILGAWFVGGLFLDGWAHQHIPDMETFFTPWHAVLYSGYFVTAAYVVIAVLRNMRRGYSLMEAIPVGYGLAAAGVLIFLVGGVADMTWHILFGIEASIEALLSPTHLILATGAIFIMTGPLRAAWLRSKETAAKWATHWPMLLCLTYLLMVFAFFTQYAHPFGATMAATPHLNALSSYGQLTTVGHNRFVYFEQGLGLISVFLQTAILMGIVLVALGRWELPIGSMTFMMAISTIPFTVMRYNAVGGNPLDTGILPLVLAAILGGIAADLLLWRLMPSRRRPSSVRWFAFAMPAILYAYYFLALEIAGGGIWWSIHLWAGTIFMAGIVGLLLSYLLIPPQATESQTYQSTQ